MDTLKLVWLTTKIVFALVVGWFLGLHALIRVLLALMGIDVVIGMIAAGILKTLSSDEAWRGIGKKVIVLGIVLVAELLSRASGLEDGQLDLGNLVAGFYSASEGLSIIENAVRVGVPVPKFLRDALAKLSPEKFENDPGAGKLVG